MSILDAVLPQIKHLSPYVPGKPVEELERELGISSAIKLASNENPLGCSPLVQDSIMRAGEQIELYPDANAFYLKQALAEKLGVNIDQITIGNGSNDVLDLVARTFLDQDAEAIFSEYAFLVYPLVTQACGATARVAKARGAGDDQPMGHDLDAMLALINEKTRLIFIANPNNPTGTWLDRHQLKVFLDAVPEQVAVVIDEAYFEYVEAEAYPDALQWLGDYSNLIVTRTFSKIYGLAGLRIGYSISSAPLCDLFNRVRQPFNGNSIALSAACAALTDEQFVADSRENNRLGLIRMQDWFEQREISFIPSVGNFLTVNFGDSSADIYQGLLRQGVIVRPVANYAMADYLRISVGSSTQLDRLFAALDKLR